ncbi:MAG: T9SS type A sorting domain-containing protein [Porphyromonadaceae bacterium]|nr:T9SS type A sorting domain-containing protein [Porphyromonadaceae bacterium]
MIRQIGCLLVFLMFWSVSSYGDDILFDFDEGNIDGWNVLNVGGGVQVSQEDKYSGMYSVKLVANAESKDYWNVQLETPQINTKSGHLYKISFWAKAVGGEGIIRLSTASAYQLTDESGNTDRQYLPELNIGENWTKYTYDVVYGSGLKAGGSILQIRIDAGVVPNKTYFIDDFEVVDLTPDLEVPEPENTIPLAKDHSKFLGNIIANYVHSSFNTYWNQVTPENAGKWGSLEYQRNNMNWTPLDRAYNHAKNNGYKFRFHTFVWGSQEPNWISSISQAEQKAEMEEFMQAVANRYPEIDYIDVVNEPLHQPSNIREAIGGSGTTGWDWIVWSFRKARELFPNAKLHINDYGIISDPNKARRYVQIVKILQKENLIDGIGIQCHEFNVNWASVSTMRTVLDILASTGLPIYVTELDISGIPEGNEESQYQLYREKFPVFWEHESVAGVTLWGYVTGSTWKNGTGIVESNGTERKAMKWLRTYMASDASKVPNKFYDTNNTSQLKASDFEIFPIPATDFLYVKGENVENVEIYNTLGKKVNVNFYDGIVDVRSLNRGVYLLVLKNEKGSFTEKFLKK